MVKSKITTSLLLLLGGLWFFFYYWIADNQEKTLKEHLKHQAEGIYHTIILTRHWISEKGGIYIKDNNTFQLITPSHFVAKLTEYTKKEGVFPYRIKIAVLHPNNPQHAPDDFEKRALKVLENKDSYWEVQRSKNHTFFRFAAPLRFKRECTNCHTSYSGKVKGCVSISFPADKAIEKLHKDKIYMAVYSVSSFFLVFVLIYVLIDRLILNPLEKFHNASLRVEKGDLDVRVDINSKDEWGRFANQFNHMIKKVSAHQRELEHKINEAVAELQKAYEELKETERYRSEFFSNITHDLKTPITAIKGATELILRKDEKNPYANIIRKNVEKLSRMIDDILDCTKLEIGQLELKLEKTDVSELIEDIIFALEPLAQEKKIKLKVINSAQNTIVMADKNRLFRAIANLVNNSIKFSPKESEILITLKNEEGNLIISIEDFGPGIPEEEREKVFNKFYRGRNNKQGMGLGLSIAKGIVEAHGGEIWIDSPNHPGVTFHIKLPVVTEN